MDAQSRWCSYRCDIWSGGAGRAGGRRVGRMWALTARTLPFPSLLLSETCMLLSVSDTVDANQRLKRFSGLTLQQPFLNNKSWPCWAGNLTTPNRADANALTEVPCHLHLATTHLQIFSMRCPCAVSHSQVSHHLLLCQRTRPSPYALEVHG